MLKNITSEELIEILKTAPDSLELIDVREPGEFAVGHLKNAKLIPLKTIMGRLAEIDWSKQVVLYCRSGARSLYAASNIDSGKRVWNLAGGILDFSTLIGASEFME